MFTSIKHEALFLYGRLSAVEKIGGFSWPIVYLYSPTKIRNKPVQIASTTCEC